MTKDEIKALISAKVAGQGDQVDAGGALAQILNGIIDAIPEPQETGILDVPFASTAAYYEHFVEVPGVGSGAIRSAVAIKCTDGVILPSRLSMVIPPVWDDEGDGSDIEAAFGFIATDGTALDAYDLFCFKIDDNKVYARRIVL